MAEHRIPSNMVEGLRFTHMSDGHQENRALLRPHEQAPTAAERALQDRMADSLITAFRTLMEEGNVSEPDLRGLYDYARREGLPEVAITECLIAAAAIFLDEGEETAHDIEHKTSTLD